LSVAGIGRLLRGLGSIVGLLGIAGVLGETGIGSLIQSNVGLRGVSGILSLFGSRSKMKLLCVVGMERPVGSGVRIGLPSIAGIRRLIEHRSKMVLLDVAGMGSLIRGRSGMGSLFRLLGVLRLGGRGVMAGWWLWLGRLGILAGSVLRVLRHGLLRGKGCGQRNSEKRQGDEGSEIGMPQAPGKTRIGLGFHVLLSEPDGPPKDRRAFLAAAGFWTCGGSAGDQCRP
jgi:hypothetical protein